ncbi:MULTISPECIES: hypothetical protein [Legionella]|uniref:Poly(A) polymerase I n=1 Tax=Legionella drozanskii LLAP-1 TaxID=1212489 RepID=A0A0W0SLW0_9GAMM|nr:MULTISPECIES: hypothetical protein [Legionella]KTC84244.1 poly(A) polymerase I [Legionella drozanskii LLAP-1]PJE07207.1 MAG: hypothetical protein CK430_14405 [Legionella sp.]
MLQRSQLLINKSATDLHQNVSVEEVIKKIIPYIAYSGSDDTASPLRESLYRLITIFGRPEQSAEACFNYAKIANELSLFIYNERVEHALVESINMAPKINRCDKLHLLLITNLKKIAHIYLPALNSGKNQSEILGKIEETRQVCLEHLDEMIGFYKEMEIPSGLKTCYNGIQNWALETIPEKSQEYKKSLIEMIESLYGMTIRVACNEEDDEYILNKYKDFIKIDSNLEINLHYDALELYLREKKIQENRVDLYFTLAAKKLYYTQPKCPEKILHGLKILITYTSWKAMITAFRSSDRYVFLKSFSELSDFATKEGLTPIKDQFNVWRNAFETVQTLYAENDNKENNTVLKFIEFVMHNMHKHFCEIYDKENFISLLEMDLLKNLHIAINHLRMYKFIEKTELPKSLKAYAPEPDVVGIWESANSKMEKRIIDLMYALITKDNNFIAFQEFSNNIKELSEQLLHILRHNFGSMNRPELLDLIKIVNEGLAWLQIMLEINELLINSDKNANNIKEQLKCNYNQLYKVYRSLKGKYEDMDAANACPIYKRSKSYLQLIEDKIRLLEGIFCSDEKVTTLSQVSLETTKKIEVLPQQTTNRTNKRALALAQMESRAKGKNDSLLTPKEKNMASGDGDVKERKEVYAAELQRVKKEKEQKEELRRSRRNDKNKRRKVAKRAAQLAHDKLESNNPPPVESSKSPVESVKVILLSNEAATTEVEESKSDSIPALTTSNESENKAKPIKPSANKRRKKRGKKTKSNQRLDDSGYHVILNERLNLLFSRFNFISGDENESDEEVSLIVGSQASTLAAYAMRERNGESVNWDMVYLQLANKDCDMVTKLPLTSLIKPFSEIQYHFFPHDNFKGDLYKTSPIGLCADPVKLEVKHSKLLKESLRKDAESRDFTIGAVYLTKSGRILDPLGNGLKHIKENKVYFIGELNENIKTDSLRLLRYTHKISQGYFPGHPPEEIQPYISLLDSLDSGKKYNTLKKHFVNGYAVKGFDTLVQFGYFSHLFPKINTALRLRWLREQLQEADQIYAKKGPQSVSQLHIFGCILAASISTYRNSPMTSEDLLGYFIREIEKLLTSYNYSDYLKKIILNDLKNVAEGRLSICVRLCIQFSDYRKSLLLRYRSVLAQPQPQFVQIPPPEMPAPLYAPPHLSMWHSPRNSERPNQENQPYNELK